MNHEDYQRMRLASSRLGEKKDCAVIAVSMVSNLPYEYVHKVYEQHGRKRRNGTPVEVTERVLKTLNLWVEDYPVDSKTIRSLGVELPYKGRFLVRVSGHILAVVDNVVLDWTAHRLHRVNQVYKVSF